MAVPKVEVASSEQLADEFASSCERACAGAIAARGRFAFVIPGGSAAEQFLPRLALARLDWSRTHVFYSDERFVPRKDPSSSASASARLLFDALGTRGPHVYPLVGGAFDPDAAAREYTATLTRVLGATPVADLALLGIGEDGHVASLFPGHAAVDDESALVLVERDSPKPPRTRLTLSLPLLAASRQVVIAAFGEGKAEPLAAVLHDPDSTLPAARLVRRAADVRFLLDPPAAARLAG